jgi:hypothetical protein
VALSSNVSMLLVVLQALFVTRGQLRTHRTLGVFAAAYGGLVFLMGLVVSVAAPAARVHAGSMTTEQASLVALYNLTAPAPV